jgi:CTP:molybdopterin cytidylyltransferase MocA
MPDPFVAGLVLAAGEVGEVEVPGSVALDVDTWDDYRAVLAAA